MNKKITLQKIEDIDAYIEDLRSSAEEAQLRLAEISEYAAPLEFLYRIKFEGIGCDPFNSQRRLNLIEQVNQTFTYLASFKAAKLLFSWHSGLHSLKMNLGKVARIFSQMMMTDAGFISFFRRESKSSGIGSMPFV